MQLGGHLVGLDARLEFRVARTIFGVAAIKQCEQVGIPRVVFEFIGRKQISQGRLVRGGLHRRALLFGGEKTGAPIEHAAGRQAARIGEHDVGGQVVRLAAQSVRHPCAHRGEAGQNEAAVHHEHRRAVQRGFAVHRMHERHVVHAGGQPRKERAHRPPTRAVLFERPMTALAVAGFGGEKLQLAAGIKRFAIAPGQFGLVIPRIHLAHSARAKNLNDRLGFGRVMPGWLRFARQQVTQRHQAEACAGGFQKLSARTSR